MATLLFAPQPLAYARGGDLLQVRNDGGAVKTTGFGVECNHRTERHGRASSSSVPLRRRGYSLPGARTRRVRDQNPLSWGDRGRWERRERWERWEPPRRLSPCRRCRWEREPCCPRRRKSRPLRPAAASLDTQPPPPPARRHGK